MQETEIGIEEIAKIASRPGAEIAHGHEQLEDLIDQSVAYLASDQASCSIERDAYWPKWNGPWWHMLLLHEMGLSGRIPESAIVQIVAALNGRYLPFFPFKEEEVPAGFDPIAAVACHCMLGTIHQLLACRGVDVKAELPWIDPWYRRYQLSDGGLNCDEQAYTSSQSSSLVSTLPPLEAVLFLRQGGFSTEEQLFLENGAGYLIERRLFRSKRTGAVIDQEWLKLSFPRFYHFDLLRGLWFLTNWALRLKQELPLSAIGEAVSWLDGKFPDGCVRVERAAWAGANTRWWDSEGQKWTKRPASTFPLLQAVSQIGQPSFYLTEQWQATRQVLSKLIKEGLIDAHA